MWKESFDGLMLKFIVYVVLDGNAKLIIKAENKKRGLAFIPLPWGILKCQ